MPLSIFDLLAEQRIADAIKRGEFDNLPGAGHPLDLHEDPLVSAEQRTANRIMKNAGFVPAEVLWRREIAALRARLAGADDAERSRIRGQVELLVSRLSATRRR